MHDYIAERALEEAKYILNAKSTIRDTARVFGVSKSTTHRDLVERLWEVNSVVADQVRGVLDINFTERTIRGGIATALKWKGDGCQ